MRPCARLLMTILGVVVALAFGPSHAIAAPCVGDCSADGAITVDEILIGVNVALGVSPLSSCPPFDVDSSGTLTVDELVSAVDGALRGCESVLPTPTPVPEGPTITSLSLAAADDSPVSPSGIDDRGREIYSRVFGSGFRIVVEAAPGPGGLDVGRIVFSEAPFDPSSRPDVQVIASQQLGDGNPIVCDNHDGLFGGIPVPVPFAFDFSQTVTDVINEMSCRVQGGARTRSGDACTADPLGSGFGFAFVSTRTTTQFCIEIARDWAFPVGDTVVAARVLDILGNPGEVREMVVRIAR